MFTQEIKKRMLAAEKMALTDVDRLGLAYCRLNCGLWDNILGPKPDSVVLCGSDEPTAKVIYGIAASEDIKVTEMMAAIQSIIGEANTSRCWWIFILEKSENEWFRWYTVERHFPSRVTALKQSLPTATLETSKKGRKVARRHKWK